MLCGDAGLGKFSVMRGYRVRNVYIAQCVMWGCRVGKVCITQCVMMEMQG